MIKKIPKNAILILVGVAAFILLAGAREFISFVADWWFFREIGYEAVFTKTFVAKMLAGLTFGVFAFLTILINLLIAGKRAAIAAHRPQPAYGAALYPGGTRCIPARLPRRRAILGAGAPLPEQRACRSC